MKNQFIYRALVGLAVWISSVNLLFAQTGKIAGKATDKKTGEALIGLTVKAQGTTAGVSTNVDGHYILALNPGTYTLDFSYLGYQTKSITNVEVKAGAVTDLNLVMEEAGGQQLREVVVTSTYNQASAGALYAQQKNRAGLSDGISSETIRRSPDKNTGEVLKRVSGTTIQDNKFVIVRGLGDRYNTATLNNATLPSTEPNRKAFSFDIVPSNLIDNIVVNKTATPDLPGDFAGGAVQITTKDIPVKNFLTFAAGWGYNSASTFNNFSYNRRYVSDYFGFDNGARKLPASASFPASTSQTYNLNAQQNIAAIKALPAFSGVSNTTALPNQNYQLTWGHLKHLTNNNLLGAVFSLTYRNSENVIPDLQRSYYLFDYHDQVNQFTTSIGALANFTYSYSNSKVSLKTLYNRVFDDKYTYRTGINYYRNSDTKYYAFDLLQKGLLNLVLDGEHKLGSKNSHLNWNLAYSNIINDQPDQEKISYSKQTSDMDDPSIPYIANNTSVGKENNRLFSNLSENMISAGVNYTKPLQMFSQSGSLKFGAGSQYRERNFAARLLGLELNVNDATQANEIRARPISTLYGQDLIDAGMYRLSEITNNSDKYDANSMVNFGYAMLDNRIGSHLRIVWGLRAENFNLALHSATVTDLPLNVNENYFDLLPSANFTYSLNDKSNLRFSYYRTLARPEFRELAPFSYYDYEALGMVEGNPQLKRTTINNADFRYEIYPAAAEVFSVSLFYKHFNNAIESNIYDVNSTPTISYFNTDQATTFGAELEWRRSLEFLGSERFLKNTIVYTNLSFVRSRVKNPSDQDYLDKSRPMVGQSPYVINAGIQHAALKNKLNLNLLYNRIGRRINKVGGLVLGNVWENPRDVLDFQAGYRVLNGRGEIKLNLSDILNQDYIFYFDNVRDKKYDTSIAVTNPETGEVSRDATFSRYKTGSTVSLSFSYSF